MLRALWTAASGMSAQQLNVDTISNNLANVNTTGFKKQRVDYQDLFYQTLREPGTTQGSPNGLEVGMGAYPVATQKIFSSGEMQRTDTPLDMAIEGNGFFKVAQADGTMAYTRAGTFRLDADGRIVTPDGLPLQPEMTIPSDAQEIIVGTNGLVSVRTSASPTPTDIGTIEMVSFSNPPGLRSLGHSIYAESPASGSPVTGTAGLDGMGQIRQGMLEQSNVSVVDEMVGMITAQRAYELSAKAVQTADDMIRISNNLRG